MEAQVRGAISDGCGDHQSEEDKVIRKGPWTMEEDSKLTQYVTVHGEGRWNTAAHCSGLKRSGKSCRLRWLNYLRPDVKRGNISLKEQLLILQLHSRWGNRWSKIAQYLPGRTDNEIKNYWRTRVQKLAKRLKCDINSQQFRDAMHHIWMPRLIERINATSSSSSSSPSSSSTSSSSLDHPTTTITNNSYNNPALVVQNIPKPSLVWVNPDPSHDSFDAHVTSNGMQNGSGLDPESESWNSWYGLQANGSYMDSLGLESFWINEDDSWLSTIDDNANT